MNFRRGAVVCRSPGAAPPGVETPAILKSARAQPRPHLVFNLRPREDFRALFYELEEFEGGAAGFAGAGFPADGGLLREVEQSGEGGLTDSGSKAMSVVLGRMVFTAGSIV